ncbi:MAG: Hint domain-containing protein [Pseudomonadota bacterium]
MRLRPDIHREPLNGRAETGPSRALGISGLTAGTEVMTDSGWLPVEQLTQGDKVMTQGGGLDKITNVRRRTFGTNLRTFWPNGLIYVPDGALGPAEAFYLLPGQDVMVRQELSKAMFDEPTRMVPAAALVGIRGVCRVMPVDLIEVIELRFADEAVIECRGGTWLHCPGVSARVKSVPLRRRRVISQAGAA